MPLNSGQQSGPQPGTNQVGPVGGFFSFLSGGEAVAPSPSKRSGKLEKLANFLNDKPLAVEVVGSKPHSEVCEESASKLSESNIQMVALLIATGIPMEVVATRTTLPEATILQICSSERFEAVLMDLQKTLEVDVAVSLLHAQKLASIRMLAQVRDDPGTLHKDKIAAAKALLQFSIDAKEVTSLDDASLGDVEKERLEIRRLLEDPALKTLLN